MTERWLSWKLLVRPCLTMPRIFQLMGSIQSAVRGRWEESIRNLEHAVDLDPRNLLTLSAIADSYRDFFDAMLKQNRRTIARWLSSPTTVKTKAERARCGTGLESRYQAVASIDRFNSGYAFLAASRISPTPGCFAHWPSAILLLQKTPSSPQAKTSPLNNDVFRFNRPFVEGIIARMTKDDDKAQSAFTTARAEQEKIVQAQPNYGPPLVVLGLIDAALGRKEEALREGRRAVELLPVERDSIKGALMIEYLAMIAAWVGDKDLACEQLAIAVRYPGPLSYGELKLLPLWDPLRGDPRFEKIVASLAPK